ncbi:hypothetical protein C6A37_00925 [Desulfobacteraceae bacterium SEEP-SAG9]|nr:hypothetical protein C6A37_00925 [Desulfobacteraceae bacterium SEEP-SAG9]
MTGFVLKLISPLDFLGRTEGISVWDVVLDWHRNINIFSKGKESEYYEKSNDIYWVFLEQ